MGTTKIKRESLKAIVKECLVEILSEGLALPGDQINERKAVTRKAKTVQRKVKQPQVSQKTQKIREEFIKDITGGGVMADMLNETLISGRAEEFAYTSEGNSSTASAMESKEPDEIFGQGAAAAWSALAFQGNIPSEDE